MPELSLPSPKKSKRYFLDAQLLGERGSSAVSEVPLKPTSRAHCHKILDEFFENKEACILTMRVQKLLGNLIVTFDTPGDEDFSEAKLRILDPDCREFEVIVTLEQQNDGPIRFIAEQTKPTQKLLTHEELK